VLGREYGKGGEEVRPLRHGAGGRGLDRAGASRAQARRPRACAQDPVSGVAKSVDSDVDNLASLLRRLDFLPVSLDVDAIAGEAKRQLHQETDYESEARNLEKYGRHVAVMPEVLVPRVDRALTTRRILAMDWIDGDPLDSLASEAVPHATRNSVARTLQELMFRELFEFRFMQTDPNIANYLYVPATGQLALLDLGRRGRVPPEFVEALSSRLPCRDRG